MESVGSTGGAVASPDGFLVLEMPTGAVAASTPVTVQEVTNLAPGGVGSAWKLSPAGAVFAKPITLTIYAGTTGRPIDELGVTFQDEHGFWHRVPASAIVRDPAALTLTVQTSHFSSWTLTSTASPRDLTGPFTLATSAAPPFTATGSATYTYAGDDAAGTFYLLSGTITLPTPLGSGAATCTVTPPEAPVFPLDTNVGELINGPPATFRWGASGHWNLTCSDGSSQLVTIAFDSEGITYPGCAEIWTTPEVSGIDASHGALTWDCTSKGRGQISGSWDFRSAACGTPCAPANPCKTGTLQCGTGAAVCVEDASVADGLSCGTNLVCSAGACVACAAGTVCTPPDACHEGLTSCSTGTSVCADSTTPATFLADGTTCGANQVCSGGSCVSCTAGLPCAPANACHQGTTSCATGASSCVDTGLSVTDGATCGAGLTCFGGACIACSQDAACTSTNPCAVAATFECTAGTAVCTDRSLQPPGANCGAGQVCSVTGVCAPCAQGASCTSSNPCSTGAFIECGSGSPVCTDIGIAPPGTSCGTGLVCSATGQCASCLASASCTPTDPCLSGAISCASGDPVCVSGPALPNGTSCGANQVCNAGLCTACNAGAACASSEPCAATAAITCGTGVEVCTPLTFVGAGASCGTNQVCSPSHACTACTLGETCTSSNPCALGGAIQCATGVPTCGDLGLKSAGTTCGVNQVCSATGVCNACTPNSPCISSNPCAATAAIGCGSGVPVCVDTSPSIDGTACGAGLTCNAGACIASRSVTGIRTVTFWPDAGPTTPAAPANASSSLVSALFPNGAQGWATYAGTVAADGSVTIPGVPTGSFWLRFQESAGTPTTYVDTTGVTSIDLGIDQAGRQTTTPATGSMLVTFPLQLPVSWVSADQIQIASANVDVWERFSRTGNLTNQSRNGTWQDNWFVGNASGAPLNLINNGDNVTVYHMKSGTISGRTYLAAVSKIDRTDVNMIDRTAYASTSRALVAGGQTPTPATGTWNLAAFEALRTAMNLPASGLGPTHNLVVGASVGTLTAPGPVPRNAAPNVFTLSVPATVPATASLNLGTGLRYTSILPSPLWKEWRGVDFTGSVSFRAAGATTGFTETVSVGRREAMPAASTLSPTLSPVRSLLVTSTTGVQSPATGTVTGVGLTPTLTWQAPATGTVTSYMVEVFRLGTSGTATTSTKVATFLTASTQVALPPGVLTAGSAHYFRVTARNIASDPWAAAPLRRVVLGAWAATLSGTLTP